MRLMPNFCRWPETTLRVALAALLVVAAAGRAKATSSLGPARSGHTATLLGNGTVLVAGGSNTTGYLASAEICAKPLEHVLASRTIQGLPHFTQDVVGHRHAFHRRSGLQAAMELGWHVSDLHHGLRHAISILSSIYHVTDQNQISGEMSRTSRGVDRLISPVSAVPE